MHSNDNVNKADFLDCIRLRQEAGAKQQPTTSFRSTTSGFTKIENNFTETPNHFNKKTSSFVETTKLVNPIRRVDAPFASISTNFCAGPNQIVEMIRRDFCSSSECDEDVATNDFQNESKFKFKKQALKTYSKEPTLSADLNPFTDNRDPDDRLSCSSGLSVEEAGGEEGPKLLTKFEYLDASNSQKMCENLQNLGEYLSISYNKTDTTINENKTATENFDVKDFKDSAETSNLYDKTAISGTQSKIYENWSDSDSILADYTTDPSDDLNELQDNQDNLTNTSLSKQSDEIDMLADIPLSEWQTPMEMPGVQISQQLVEAQCSTESVGFSTASRKLIPISESTKNKGFLLMTRVTTATSDTEESDNRTPQPKRAQRGLSRIVQPRKSPKKILSDSKTTEPSHDILIKTDLIESNTFGTEKEACKILQSGLKLIETTEPKLAKPMSDVFDITVPSNESKFMKSDLKAERLKSITSIFDLDLFQAKDDEVKLIHISSASSKASNQPSSTPMNKPISLDIRKAFLACQKIINVSEETKDKAVKVMAELKAFELENQTFINDPDLIEPIPSSNKSITFHTACKQLLGLSDQATNKVNEILGNLEATTSQSILVCKPRLCEFHAACTKMINVMEETKIVALKILRNVEETKETKLSQEDATNGPNGSDCCVYEENVALALAESQTENSSTCQQAYETNDLSTLGTAKLRTQQNTNDVCLNESRFNHTECKNTSNSQPETKFPRTPPCTRDIHPSLSQLACRSPLDESTKSAIIGRRNLLTLNRRKVVKRIHTEVFAQSKEDIPMGFAPISNHTSTPLVDRNPNVIEAVVDFSSNSGHDKLSPTYTPVNKKRRRLGLSRMPNNF